MNDSEKTKTQLIEELEALRAEVETLHAEHLPPKHRPKSEHLKQLQAIYFLGDMISQARTPIEIYENALNAVRITLRADGVGISLFEPSGQASFVVSRGLSETFREAARACLPWSATEQAPPPLFIPNIRIAPVAPILRDLLLDENFLAIGIFPLASQHRLFGHLLIAYKERHPFSEDELWLTQTIAGNVAFATERKRTEDALQYSKQLYHLLVQNLPNTAILLFDQEFRYLIAEGEILAQYGLTHQALEGRKLGEILPDKITDLLIPSCKTALAGNENSFEIEYSQHNYIVQTLPVEDEQDVIFAGMVVIRDITEQKRSERKQQQLFEAEREQRLLAETLGEVVLALTSKTDLESVLDEILKQLQRIISYSTANIMLLKEDTLHIVRWQGWEDFGDADLLTTLEQPLAQFPLDAQVIETQQPMIVPDTHQNDSWVIMDKSAWIRSFIAVPLCLHKNVLGLLRLDSHIPTKFSQKDVDHLVPLANAAAVALENVRLYEETQSALAKRASAEEAAFTLNRKFLMLQYAGATIAASLDLPHILSTFSQEIVELLDVEGCVISQWDRNTNKIQVVAKHGPEQWYPTRSLHSSYQLTDIPLIKWVLTQRQAASLTLNQQDLAQVDLQHLQEQGIKALLVLPMEFQGRVVGLVEVIDTQVERIFSTEDVAFTQLLVNQAATTIENARLFARAQQELADKRLTEQELRRIASRNQVILDAIPDMLFYFNNEGNLLDYKIHQENQPSLPTSNGQTQNSQNHTYWLPPDFSDQASTHIQQALESQRVKVFEYQRPGLFAMEDFEARLVASGKNEVLAIVRNITEQKQAERQLIRTERLAALGQLAAALAHEINNPLQAMKSNLDLMLNYPISPDESEKYLQVLQRQIERVNEITQQVLNFARPRPVPQEEISVEEQIKQVLALTRTQLDQHNIKVMIDVQPDLPEVMANSNQISQIFLNLIINAIEAIEKDGQINISAYLEKPYITIAFTSSGPIIPNHILPHIFEPFFTTKSEGSGLGLWVSHSLVEQHRGSLTVENLTNNHGVVFTVRLPQL